MIALSFVNCYNADEIRGDGDISGIVGDANDNTIIEKLSQYRRDYQ